MKWLFGQNYRIAKVSTFYLTVSEIIIPSLKVRGQFEHALIIELKRPKSSCLKWTWRRFGIDYRAASLLKRYLTAKGIIPEGSSMVQF